MFLRRDDDDDDEHKVEWLDRRDAIEMIRYLWVFLKWL